MRNNKSGQFTAISVDLKPTFELGYFGGWLLGDGSLNKTKRRNYIISFETTRPEMIPLWRGSFISVFPQLSPLISSRVKTRSFPNGSQRTDRLFSIRLNSKVVYEAFYPYKCRDYLWGFPKFLNTTKAKRGFLRGYFDAEGSIHGVGITLTSKHRSNLEKIVGLLAEFSIESVIYRPGTILYIPHRFVQRFVNLIGFGIKAKANKLEHNLALAKLKYSQRSKKTWQTRRLRYGLKGRGWLKCQGKSGL